MTIHLQTCFSFGDIYILQTKYYVIIVNQIVYCINTCTLLKIHAVLFVLGKMRIVIFFSHAHT